MCANTLSPRSGIERLGGLPPLPHIGTPGDFAVAPADDEAWDTEKVGGDFSEMRAAFLQTDSVWQVVQDLLLPTWPFGAGLFDATGPPAEGAEADWDCADRWLSETWMAQHNKQFAIGAEREGSAFVTA